MKRTAEHTTHFPSSFSIDYSREGMELSYGLALSGGALRGAAHIGLLEVFLENKLVPRMLAGSVPAALWAVFMRPA